MTPRQLNAEMVIRRKRELEIRPRDDLWRKPKRTADDKHHAPAGVAVARQGLRELNRVKLFAADAQRDDDIPFAHLLQDGSALPLTICASMAGELFAGSGRSASSISSNLPKRDSRFSYSSAASRQ